MAPPDFAFRAMREAVLGLAVDTPALRPLINPRQSSPVRYDASPLNATAPGADGFSAGPAAGAVLAEAPVRWLGGTDGDPKERDGHLTDVLRAGTFTLIHLQGKAAARGDAGAALAEACRALKADSIDMRRVEVRSEPTPPAGAAPDALGVDLDGSLAARYGVPSGGALYAVRPDGHVLGRWPASATDITATVGAAIRRCLAGGSAQAERAA